MLCLSEKICKSHHLPLVLLILNLTFYNYSYIKSPCTACILSYQNLSSGFKRFQRLKFDSKNQLIIFILHLVFDILNDNTPFDDFLKFRLYFINCHGVKTIFIRSLSRKSEFDLGFVEDTTTSFERKRLISVETVNCSLNWVFPRNLFVRERQFAFLQSHS